MKMWIEKLCAGAVVGAVFLAAGFFLGIRRPTSTKPVTDLGRFHVLEDDRAFDTKTGKTCLMNVNVPVGFKLDGSTPSCSELTAQ
jgi:hypothetical protein